MSFFFFFFLIISVEKAFGVSAVLDGAAAPPAVRLMPLHQHQHHYQELFPAQCNNAVQHLRLTEALSSSCWEQLCLFSTFKIAHFFYLHIFHVANLAGVLQSCCCNKVISHVWD